jgi:hypothetical protein
MGRVADGTKLPLAKGKRAAAALPLANMGSLGSRAASPAFVLAQAFAVHGVHVAP